MNLELFAALLIGCKLAGIVCWLMWRLWVVTMEEIFELGSDPRPSGRKPKRLI